MKQFNQLFFFFNERDNKVPAKAHAVPAIKVGGNASQSNHRASQSMSRLSQLDHGLKNGISKLKQKTKSTREHLKAQTAHDLFSFTKSRASHKAKSTSITPNLHGSRRTRKSKHVSKNPATMRVKKPKQTSSNNQRVVFVNIRAFYQQWRSIPSVMIHDAILIFPGLFTEWIAEPSKYLGRVPIPEDIARILRDDVFSKLLQWKYHQQMLFCTLNTSGKVKAWERRYDGGRVEEKEGCSSQRVSPFWSHLSDMLQQVSDPSNVGLYGSATFGPLTLDDAFYRTSGFKAKYANVSGARVVSALKSAQCTSTSVLCELLHQSNPTLKIVCSTQDMQSFVEGRDSGLLAVMARPQLEKFTSITVKHEELEKKAAAAMKALITIEPEELDKNESKDSMDEEDLDDFFDDVLDSILDSPMPSDDVNGTGGDGTTVGSGACGGEEKRILDRIMENDSNWWFADDYDSD